MIPRPWRRWAWARLMRWPEGTLVTLAGLDWLALVLLETGRHHLRTRWRMWTALPGDRVVCWERDLVGEVVKVRRAGRIDVISATTLTLRYDPLALDRLPFSASVVAGGLAWRDEGGPVLRLAEPPGRWVR